VKWFAVCVCLRPVEVDTNYNTDMLWTIAFFVEYDSYLFLYMEWNGSSGRSFSRNFNCCFKELQMLI